ncbi:MAG TPA: DUF3306 domain-containing protein [Afifellaceae bacterium]|nr:DUF3306 domain-containing protein [Afifellaceae bacterium]
MTPDREDPDRENMDRPFLERWSRRKREGEASDRADGRPAEQAAGKAEIEAEGEDAEARLRRLESNRAAAEAIDLDSLDAASDLSPFYKEGVPKALKMAAMRAMWRTSPVFANLDGLNDYDQNFADPELIRKFTGTAWKIGRGYLTDDPEPAAADAVEVAGETPEDPVESEEVASVETEIEDPEIPDNDTAPADPEGETHGQQALRDAAHNEPEHEDEEGDDHPRVPLRTRLALDDWQTD